MHITNLQSEQKKIKIKNSKPKFRAFDKCSYIQLHFSRDYMFSKKLIVPLTS